MVILVIYSIIRCANPVSPSGGPKDILPPVVVETAPANHSVNFVDDRISISFDELESLNIQDNKIEKEREQHRRIAYWYKRLYREHQDPRWIRELYYHTMAAGDKEEAKEFGALYKSEIFFVGYYWFRVLKRYEDALWAYQTAHKLGLRTELTEMRMAACLMRVNDRNNEKKAKTNEIPWETASGATVNISS